MVQKGFAPIYLLIIIGAIAFVIIKFTSPTQPSIISPKPSVIPKIESGENQATASAQLLAKLEKYLTVEAALLGVSDNISLSFRDFDHNKEINIEPTRQWIPASTIKAFVVLEAFRQRDLGLIDFDKEITISADNVVSTELETDEFPRLREGTKTTIYQLVESMIIQSDNIAYNTLLDILDRRNINLALRNIGITETVVGEKLNLDESQFQQDLQVPGRQPNTTTAKDLATFFDLLYNKKIAHSEEILSIFKRQKINNMIPAFLPENTIVAHKTGNWAPIFHDSGVIYKPGDPFVLVILSNSNAPKVIANLARVAYFQNASSVGQSLPENLKQEISGRFKSKVYLTSAPSKVLGVSTDEKFPKITAADLGITISDLTTDKPEAKKVSAALITPSSPLYALKVYLEKLQTDQAQTNEQKINNFLKLATNRLAETKTLINGEDFSGARQLLIQSEDYLNKALSLVEKDKNEHQLLQIKQLSDLHFAILAEVGERVKDNQKEQFVDLVYYFYQKNQQEVAPKVKVSEVANPLEQQPIIGTVSEIKNNQVTVQFDDGSIKVVALTSSTPVRGFHKEDTSDGKSLKIGSKIAVLGQTTKQGKIAPTFILRDIPKNLPDKKEGTVLEIDSEKRTLKIQNPGGEKEEVRVDQTTVIKGRDTAVSLEGIRAGSQVTVFGETTEMKTSVKAVTVTVTKNSSGKEEKVEVKSEPKKEEPKKAPQPPKQPESKKGETKPSK